MTDRERILKVMNHEPVDRHPIHLAGPWNDTLVRWRTEGLPAEVTDAHEFSLAITQGFQEDCPRKHLPIYEIPDLVRAPISLLKGTLPHGQSDRF